MCYLCYSFLWLDRMIMCYRFAMLTSSSHVKTRVCVLYTLLNIVSSHGRLGIIYQTNTILIFSIHYWMRYGCYCQPLIFYSCVNFFLFFSRVSHYTCISNHTTPSHFTFRWEKPSQSVCQLRTLAWKCLQLRRWWWWMYEHIPEQSSIIT